MSAAEHRALVQQWADQLWNARDFDLIETLYGEEIIIHGPGGGEPIQGDRGSVRRRHERFLAAIPDFQMTVEDVIAEGDRVVVRWVGHGTHQGELSGVEPTGNPVHVAGINIWRIADGKIVERWGNTDEIGLLRQMHTGAGEAH